MHTNFYGTWHCMQHEMYFSIEIKENLDTAETLIKIAVEQGSNLAELAERLPILGVEGQIPEATPA